MSSGIMNKEILSHCLLTVSDDIKSKCSNNETLLEAVTQLGFKITDFRALTLENRSTYKEDLIKLADALTSDSKIQESSRNAASNICYLLSGCKLTVSEEINSGSLALFDAITQAGFKIIKFGPLVIEKDSVSREDLVKLCNLLTSDNEINEFSANPAVTGAASFTDGGQEQLEGESGSTAGNSSLVHKVKISESEVEDYVMKKHHFQLAGEYFKDRDWKELFDKAEEINEGFCFRGKDVSANEYHLFHNLKKIAFETFGIPDDEAHRIKEAAEHIHGVLNSVCVIDYGSTPYLVGPKAQVHAVKEEILCRLKKDGVDCHFALSEVLLKAKTTVMAKENTRHSCAETSLQQTDTKVLEGEKSSDKKEKWMKGETEGHAGDNKSKAKLISDQLKCEDSDVTSLENGPKVTPKFAPTQKVASKLNVIPKLQETVEDGNNFNNLDFLCSKRMMQSGIKAEGHSFSMSSDGARPKNIEAPKSTNPFDLSYRRENKSGLKAEDDSFSIPSDGARPKIFDVHRSKSYFDLTDLSYRKENQSSVKADEDSFSISPEGARQKTVEVPRSTRPFSGRYRRESQFGVKAEDDSFSVSSDGARPKNTDLPRSISHFDLTNLSYRREDTLRSSYSRYKPWLPEQVKTDFSAPRGLSQMLSPSLQNLSQGQSTDGASLRQVRYAKQAAGQYTGQSNIKVHIQKANITTLKVDCIANATTTKLDLSGRVAQVISSAAGKELHEACKRFIAAGNTVPVTGVFVSPGGRLPAKHVLHAVGPRWGLYSNKKKCTDDLRRTVLRCLVEAMRLGLSSIALPSIGAGNSNIPKELCARSYMEAVKSFDAIFGQDKDCTLKEIHFVDIADIMVNHIQECFMKYWGEPCNSLMKNLDETFSRNHLRSKSLKPKLGVLLASRGPESRGQRSKTSGHSAALPIKPFYGINLKHHERNSDYQIRRIRFCISSIPALNFHMTPVITIGKEFDKLSGIQDYNVKANCKKCDDYTSQKKAYTYKYLCKPGGKQQRLVCRLYPKPKSPKDIESAALKLDLALSVLTSCSFYAESVTSCVLTSCILYAEPNNKKTLFKGRGLQLDLTLVEGFANNVLKFLEKVSQDPTCMLKRVVITASDDACPHLIKVFESCVFVRKAGI